MGLFGEKKKKTEPVTILSESEIQKKLYGEYKSGNVTEAQSPMRDARQELSGSTQMTVEHPEHDDGQASLFDSPEDQPVIETPEKKIPAAPKNSQPQQIEEWVKKENEVISQITPSYTSSTYKPEKPQTAAVPKFPLDFKKALAIICEASVSFFQLVLGVVANFLLLFDLRKPRMRGFAYFLGALTFIIVLLAGIHFLNVQREEAMQGRFSKVPAVISGTNPTSAGFNAQTTQQGNGGASVVADAKTREQRAAAVVQQNRIAKKPYVIQVATYATENDATNMASDLRGSDLTSFVKPLSRPNGKQYYCVFLGRYANYSEAEKALIAFKTKDAAKPFQDAFVRTLNK